MGNLQTLDDNNISKKLEFKGDGSTYFGIWIVNALLTGITLGIYHAWAKTKERNYLYSNTYLAGSYFTYHGTGKELFIGYVKAFFIFLIPYLILTGVSLSQDESLIIFSSFVFLAFILVIIPIAIHGTLRFRTARTSWRGIFMSYTGDRGEFIKLFLKNIFFVIITFGIYSSWANINIRRYILEHLNFGNVKATFKGKGDDLFVINLIGSLLTIITLGIYSFWYTKNVLEFYVKNTELDQDGTKIRLQSTFTAGRIFGLFFINLLLIIFTIGLATPWVIIRTIDFYMDNIEMSSNFNPEKIVQGTIDTTATATGDSLLEDIGF